MKVTIEKKTDQLNYEDFLGGITRIVTIAGVKKGTKEQQYDIAIEGDERVWRPAVTVLKQLVEAWGDEAKEWIGRRAVLFGDPDVMFGGKKVGGIRVSHLSHIDGPVTSNLSVTRGKREKFTVQPLPDQPTAAPADKPLATQIADMLANYETGFGVTRSQLEAYLALPTAEWTAQTLGALRVLGGELSRGEKRVEDEFSSGEQTTSRKVTADDIGGGVGGGEA